MYDFEQLKLAIQQSVNLKQEDKDLLYTYHLWKNGPNVLRDEETKELEEKIGAKLNDKEFNRRLASFETEIRTSQIEFPYLDVLKKRQVYQAIENSKSLTKQDKEFLSLYHKAQNEPDKMSQNDTTRLNEIAKTSSSYGFNRRLSVFEKEMKASKIEFHYLDVLKKNLVDRVIKNSKILTQEDMKFLFLYNKAMNKENETSDEEKENLSKLMIEKLNDKAFTYKFLLLQNEMHKNSIVFHYLDTLIKYSFGMQNASYIDNYLKKVQRAEYITSMGGALEEDEKLTMAELGMVEKLKD